MLMPFSDDPITLVAAQRTPIGHFNGCFKDTPAPELAAACIKSLLNKTQLASEHINTVNFGCVLPAGIGQAPARQAALIAGLPYSTCATTLNKMCGSGMQAVIMAHDSLVAKSQRIMIAGGMENMTRAPYLLTKARSGYRIGADTLYDHMMLDGLEDAYHKGQAMGVFADQCAQAQGISREEQDDFARQSIERAQNAIDTQAFQEEITPITLTTRQGEQVISKDEGPSQVKPHKIATLKPAFSKDGTVTAANASSLSDGAAAVLMMPLSVAQQHQQTPLATIRGHHTHAQAPDQFTTAPIHAIQNLCQRIDWPLDSIDLFEINEAFAVVTLAAIKSLQLNPDKVNVNGGACVLGHPIGASGARIIVTLIHALQQRQQQRGIAALCIGGGEATAIAIELNP